MKNEQSIIIRRFEEKDATQISEVIRETMLKTNIKDYPLSILKPLHDYFTPDKVKVLASERFCVVAEEGNNIIGTGALEDNELKTIFVKPQYQGLGIGIKLLNDLESYGRSKHLKMIKVTSSISGIEFYKKAGYQIGEKFISENAGEQTWMTKVLKNEESL